MESAVGIAYDAARNASDEGSADKYVASLSAFSSSLSESVASPAISCARALFHGQWCGFMLMSWAYHAAVCGSGISVAVARGRLRTETDTLEIIAVGKR